MIVKQTSNFIPCPDGVHNAVCVDVTPIEKRETPWGIKDSLRIVWEVEAKMEDGRPFLCSKRYAPSLHIKANLRKDLKSWRGKDFTDEELNGFDLEKILGVNCQLVVTHDHGKNGETYANVGIVMKAKTSIPVGGSYVRVKDRPEYKERVAKEKAAADAQGTANPPKGHGNNFEPPDNMDDMEDPAF